MTMTMPTVYSTVRVRGSLFDHNEIYSRDVLLDLVIAKLAGDRGFDDEGIADVSVVTFCGGAPPEGITRSNTSGIIGGSERKWGTRLGSPSRS
jgi:hypothetical protein